MHEDKYVYIAQLPDGIDEMVAPGIDGYTIYIDDMLSILGRRKAYQHALDHINGLDWEKEIVSDVEFVRH